MAPGMFSAKPANYARSGCRQRSRRLGEMGKSNDDGNPPVYSFARQPWRKLRVVPDLGEEPTFMDLSFRL